MFKRTAGFSLMEVMVIVVMIGVVAAIVIPILSNHDRAREEIVKANARDCQLFLEDLAAENDGLYPKGVVGILDNFSTLYKNPFGDSAFHDGFGREPGACYYLVNNDRTHYRIRALGKNGTTILELSN